MTKLKLPSTYNTNDGKVFYILKIFSICRSTQNSDNFKVHSAPQFSVFWSTTLPNQVLWLTFTRSTTVVNTNINIEKCGVFLVDTDYCAKQPCGDGATCQSRNFNYYCICPPGQTGGVGLPCRGTARGS